MIRKKGSILLGDLWVSAVLLAVGMVWCACGWAVTGAIDHVNRVGGIDGNSTIFPELYGAIGDGSTDDTLAIEAAIATCPAAGCRIVFSGDYRVTSNETMPSQSQLEFMPGATLKPDSGYVVTIASPSNVHADSNREIFDCSASSCITFTAAGTIHNDWFGPDKTGATDSQSALAAAVSSAPVNSTIAYGPGTFLIQTQLAVTKGINLVGTCGATGTTIKAGASLTSGAIILYYPVSPSTEHLRIECLILDGNDTAQHGLEIKNGTPMTVQDVIVKECADRGFFVNAWGGYDGGDALPYSGIQNITFNRCHAQHNNVGFYVGRLGSGMGMNFTFNDCWGYYNNFGTYFKGDNETNADRPSGFTVAWTGGSIESGPKDCYADGCKAIAMAVAFRVKDGVKLTARNVYIENYHYTNDYHWWVSEDSRVDLYGANVGIAGWYSFIEDNSTICDFGPNIFDGPPYYIYAGAQGKIKPQCFGKFWNKSTYGPPNFRTPIAAGYVTYHGQKFVDSELTEWFNATNDPDATATGSSMYRKDRWIPLNGRIVIPFTYTDMNVGNWLAYWNQVPMVVTAVDMVITTTFESNNTNNYCNGGNGYLVSIRKGQLIKKIV